MAASSPCEEETRAEPLALGQLIEAEAGQLSLRVDAAVPEPPEAGNNRWTVAVSDGQQDLADCSLALDLWMPDHGHGADTPVVEQPEPGVYDVELDFLMGGFWEVSTQLECGELSDQLQLDLCVES